jgi:hypothetical protein
MKIAEYQHVIKLYKLLEKRFSKPKDIEDYKRLQKELYQLSLMAAEVGAEEELRDYQAYLQKWKAEFEKAIALAKAEKDDSKRMPMRYEEVDPMLDAYNQYKNEGKSPHKKGTKKYNKHMAAIHANEDDKGGRPRGAAHIENERFWDLSEDELIYIIKDAAEAVEANPTARKATQGPGNWADQINDAYTVLIQRDKHTAESFKSSLAKHANESSPAPDGPKYKQGDFVVMPNGRTYVLDEYDDGIWWATDDDGGDIEFKPGTEKHHEPRTDHDLEKHESISSAVNTMRGRFDDYEQDPSNRWKQYEQYSNQRKQISQRAKAVTEWGNSHLDQEIAKQKAEDDEKSDKKWKQNFDKQSKERLRHKKRRDDQQADEA